MTDKTRKPPRWSLAQIYHHVLRQSPSPEAAKIAIFEAGLHLWGERREHKARPDLKLKSGEKPPSVWHVALEQPLGLATLLPLVIEGRKWLLRRRAPHAEVLDVQRAVAPDRAGAR